MKNEEFWKDVKYKAHFVKETFLSLIEKSVDNIGVPIIKNALILYYCYEDPNTSPYHKTAIAIALGYFILPFDLIPDTIPMIGYTDDILVIT